MGNLTKFRTLNFCETLPLKNSTSICYNNRRRSYEMVGSAAYF